MCLWQYSRKPVALRNILHNGKMIYDCIYWRSASLTAVRTAYILKRKASRPGSISIYSSLQFETGCEYQPVRPTSCWSIGGHQHHHCCHHGTPLPMCGSAAVLWGIEIAPTTAAPAIVRYIDSAPAAAVTQPAS